ncbi:hypothetical protein JXB28_05925 [Candidatus Woesearchaeota archaeon]|nr:hypothetical protein [Candidatus Woesearchaeota archaeon]
MDGRYAEEETITRCLVEFDLGKKSALILYDDGDIDIDVSELSHKYKVGTFYTFNMFDHFADDGHSWKGPSLNEYAKCNNDKKLKEYLDERRLPTKKDCTSDADCGLYNNTYFGIVTACHKEDWDCIEKAEQNNRGSYGHGPGPAPRESFYVICQGGECIKEMNCSVCNSEITRKNCAEVQYVTGGSWQCARIGSCGCKIGCSNESDGVCPHLLCEDYVDDTDREIPYSICCYHKEYFDADCCQAAGKYWIKTNQGYVCSDKDYNPGCNPGQECSATSDGCCPNWCIIGTDADCCKQAGKYWLTNSWGGSACYNADYNRGCSPSNDCETKGDGCCPNWCSAGSDIDCCKQEGKYWLTELSGSEGCYDSHYSKGCSPESECEIFGDGCCPNWCSAGSDADCCKQAGKYWLTTSWGSYICSNQSNYNSSCLANSDCEIVGDGCCPSWCALAIDIDCCQQAGGNWQEAEYGFSCFLKNQENRTAQTKTCKLSLPDGECPSWCQYYEDADCCNEVGGYIIPGNYEFGPACAIDCPKVDCDDSLNHGFIHSVISSK